jgi:hypothetical protein
MIPDQCQICDKKTKEFYSPNHPDHGMAMACGIMVEMQKAGTENIPCTYRTVGRPNLPETPACPSCIVTRPACGGCAAIIDSDAANMALQLVGRLKERV